jgi:hypothetical protein
MIANRMRTFLPLAAVTITITILAGAGAAQAAAPPIKLVLASHFGREVNLTEVSAKGGAALEDICTVESKDECQPGKPSGLPGGFESLQSVAGTLGGNVYVADTNNHRVQELTSNGEFVLMFGKEVNLTEVTAKAGAALEDVCTATSKDVCKAGIGGTAAGQLNAPQSAAVDPSSGDVYVAEYVFASGGYGLRVQKFTAGGQFVLEIGKEVNEKTKGNLCTEKEVEEKLGVKCTGPAQAVRGSTEHGAFNFEPGSGNVLAVGGSEDLLYVGDENRVQEFKAEGEWKGEIPLEPAGGRVAALAIDEETGDLYLAYGYGTNIVREFNSKGESINELEVSPSEGGATVFTLSGLALDSKGHLAVVGEEEQEIGVSNRKLFGSLYGASTGHLMTAITIPSTHEGFNVTGIGFNGNGELYVATGGGQEVLAYKPEPVAELMTGPTTCLPGAEHETDVTLECTLNGEVNPEGVSATEAWFEWGRTEALGQQTPKQKVEATEPLHTMVEERPNTTLYDKLVGEDLNVKQPEELTGEQVSVTTPAVAPHVIGEPDASFVTASSAVMFSELNPENASSEYFFEYAPELVPGEETLAKCPGVRKVSCPGVASTPAGQSAVYGKIGTTLEATGLQPGTTYRYRLLAGNTAGEVKSGEGSLKTGPAPTVQAVTGPASLVTATSAVISATVNGDGQPATYKFEMGVYHGALTQYGVVFSGLIGGGTAPVGESLELTGLQPGVTYAYRIVGQSGYGEAEGETLTFTTAGLPSVLVLPSVLAQLPVPPVSFPKVIKPLTNAQKLATALKACKKKVKKQRASCERSARKKYPAKSKKK